MGRAFRVFTEVWEKSDIDAMFRLAEVSKLA